MPRIKQDELNEARIERSDEVAKQNKLNREFYSPKNIGETKTYKMQIRTSKGETKEKHYSERVYKNGVRKSSLDHLYKDGKKIY